MFIEQWEVINNRARLGVDESHSEVVDGDGQLSLTGTDGSSLPIHGGEFEFEEL
jgi:hypothetical protein